MSRTRNFSQGIMNITGTASGNMTQAGTAGSTVLNTGTALVNFGTGSDTASTVITGQTNILSTSVLHVTISPVVTSNNGIDEHWVENLTVAAGNIVAGTGFTIYMKCEIGRAYGNYNVAWAWN